MVALTQVELPTAGTEHIRSLLSEQGIHFANVQWHQVIELVLGYRFSDDSVDSRYLLDEFVRFVRRDYDMGYYDAEILVQDVNPLNAKIFMEGWMYVTSPKDKKAPLYFAPYFTQQGVNTGISMISRVLDAKTQRLADTEDVGEAPTTEHLNRWRSGLCMLRDRADNEGFSNFEARLFFLDRPIALLTPPLTKKAFKLSASSKQIPNQIPKGFSLRFDDLLMSGSQIGPP